MRKKAREREERGEEISLGMKFETHRVAARISEVRALPYVAEPRAVIIAAGK